jgi:hypothetical protein
MPSSRVTSQRLKFNNHDAMRRRETLMEIRLADCISIGNLVVLLGIYYKMSVMLYQHKLMWKDFAQRKGISTEINGRSAHGD